MSIELRLSDVNPPAPDPPRTIYRDIVNLPDPTKLGVTIRYFNNDSVTLYFQITGSGTGYTFGTVNLGSLAAGTDAYANLDELASRAKPSTGDLPNGELDENITLTLKAYTDSGYTNLKWTYYRVVGVHWINSADPSFTVDVLNDFNDGTVQGWAGVNEACESGTPSVTVGVSTDYVLSTPYSLRMYHESSYNNVKMRSRIYKSFTTANKTKVFAIIDVRNRYGTAPYTTLKNLRVHKNADQLIWLGRPYDATTGAAGEYLPPNKWFRIIVPLPPNTTLELRIAQELRTGYGADRGGYLNLDDFKIISK